MLEPLGRLIVAAVARSQVIVVSRARELVDAVDKAMGAVRIELAKEFGRDNGRGMRQLDEPSWKWTS